MTQKVLITLRPFKQVSWPGAALLGSLNSSLKFDLKEKAFATTYISNQEGNLEN
jgi:hypothetical protein